MEGLEIYLTSFAGSEEQPLKKVFWPNPHPGIEGPGENLKVQADRYEGQ